MIATVERMQRRRLGIPPLSAWWETLRRAARRRRVVRALRRQSEATVARIALRLGWPHQMAAAVLEELVDLGRAVSVTHTYDHSPVTLYRAARP